MIESSNPEDYAELVEDARAVFEQPSTPAVIRLIDRHLGPEFFSVRELSDAGRTEFIEHMVTDLVDRLGATYGYLYDEHRRNIEAFERAGADVPRERPGRQGSRESEAYGDRAIRLRKAPQSIVPR